MFPKEIDNIFYTKFGRQPKCIMEDVEVVNGAKFATRALGMASSIPFGWSRKKR